MKKWLALSVVILFATATTAIIAPYYLAEKVEKLNNSMWALASVETLLRGQSCSLTESRITLTSLFYNQVQ